MPWLPWALFPRCYGYHSPSSPVAMVTVAHCHPSPSHTHCRGYSGHPSPIAMDTVVPIPMLPWLRHHSPIAMVAMVTVVPPPIHLLPMVTVTPPITRCHGYRGPNKPIAMVTIVTQHPLPWLPFSPNVRCHGYRGHLPHVLPWLPWFPWVPMCLLPWLPHHTPVALVAMVTVPPPGCCPW